MSIQINKEANRLFTKIGKETLKDRYLLPNEDFQDMFKRVSEAFADDEEHAQRLYDYMSNHWFMPATPILSNGGTNRGLPISCYLQYVEDSITDIIDNWKESSLLSCRGGGLGIYYGDVRSVGERVGIVGNTCGVIPFMKVNDSLALAISQGNLRRGSAACYLPIWHGDIEEFLEIRKASGGDPNRKALNLHQGVCIDDKFMEAVEQGLNYDLISPSTGAVIKTVKARDLWIKLLTLRLETGEPYIVWIDRLREATPKHHKKLGLYPVQSNLCSEITLPTTKERTAVCCLSSVNLEYWDSWKDNTLFIEDIMRFLDNVLTSFIKNAPLSFGKAITSAVNERSVGLGAMGFHSLLQSKLIPFDSAVAKSLNINIFKNIKTKVEQINGKLAREKGACPDAQKNNEEKRFSYTMAIAPNASISVIAGSVSPGIEPYPANIFNHKSLSGTFMIKNKFLDNHIKELYNDKYDEIWKEIINNEGSIQTIEVFSKEIKEVFKTAFEIDQRYLITHTADRQPFIDQAQSLNIFLPSTIDKKSLHNIHMDAWKLGLKTMYYLRSKSIRRAEKVSLTISNIDECLSCN
jgi:ribonucleoside-diphosphate reductase alpha chain